MSRPFGIPDQRTCASRSAPLGRLRSKEAVRSEGKTRAIAKDTTDGASSLFPLELLFEPKASRWTRRARWLELTSRTPVVAFDALLRRFGEVADRLVAGA